MKTYAAERVLVTRKALSALTLLAASLLLSLITAGAASRFPIEFGWAHTVDAEPITGVTAQRPIVQAELVRADHPTFYGYSEKTVAIKYAGGFTLRVGIADQANLLARYTGGDASVLSGAMVGADQLRQKAVAVDVPNACNGKGRVMLFANNPILSLIHI